MTSDYNLGKYISKLIDDKHTINIKRSDFMEKCRYFEGWPHEVCVCTYVLTYLRLLPFVEDHRRPTSTSLGCVYVLMRDLRQTKWLFISQ